MCVRYSYKKLQYSAQAVNKVEMKKIILSCLVLWICNDVLGVRFSSVVEIAQGKLRGLLTSSGQKQYLGIPYATAGRFEAPKESPKWEGVLEAKNLFTTCAQTIYFFKLGVEDCLYLDVYTPRHANSETKLPVVFFIHGGAFYFGAKWLYDPEFLVSKNVVTVVINYRLGVFGFLCLNGISNLGLKDQVAALKWVQKNIAAFGGDPDNVTIMGQSAGASSAGMHMLSRSSAGLFHKAILMSGTPFAPWTINVLPLKSPLEDARKLNSVNNEIEAYETLAKASLDDLIRVTDDVPNNVTGFKYVPCIDANYPEPFFHDSPFNILKSGQFNKVPIMMSFTNAEGALFYGLNDEMSFVEWENNFIERIPPVFSWCSKKDREEIADKIRLHYFKDKTIKNVAVREIVNYCSDWGFYSTIHAFSKLMAQLSDQPVYTYMFSYEGRRNIVKLLSGNALKVKGATHCDDLLYIFKPASLSLPLSVSDSLVIERYTTMIKNFASYGNPIPYKSKLLPVAWPVTTVESSKILRLDHNVSIIDFPKSYRGDFFLEMLCTYGLSGYVPCESALKCNVH